MPTLRTLRVFGGISRKRLEQAIRELQLPVIVVREPTRPTSSITLRNYYKQKAPALREAEERGLPIFVLKSNTIVQMQASLTSIFALEVDPREAALREVEEAIGLVHEQQQPVELSPQNAYIRRLQHQMAERANLVSRSRGREPYRRVRLYPDHAAHRLALTRGDPAAPRRRVSCQAGSVTEPRTPAADPSAPASGTSSTLALDRHVGQPAEPARQPPVPLAEEPHRGRQEDAPDDRRVDEHRDREPEPELLDDRERQRHEDREDARP